MGDIYIVGLGPGDAGLITRQTEQLLQSGRKIYLRTRIHPTVKWLDEHHIPYESLDIFYEKESSFDAVYSSIVKFLAARAGKGESLVYAVPGSPLVAEKTVVMLRRQAEKSGIPVHICAGMSFLELLYIRAELDPVQGLTVVDASELDTLPATIGHPIVITQIYNQETASEVKLTLMERYGDEAPVSLIRHLSLPDESVLDIPLFELDRYDMDHLTLCVFDPGKALPPAVKPFTLKPLVQVMKALRSPRGCPWDKSQNHETLRTYFLQEAWEVIDAIDRGDSENLKEELGDVLFQIIFHARLAEEAGLFTMQDVVDGITDKMKERHPFVFERVRRQEAAEMLGSWELRKMKEKKRAHLLSGIPQNLPSLLFTCIMQNKVSSMGIYTAENGDICRQHMESAWKQAARGLEQNLTREKAEYISGRALFETVRFLRFYRVDPEVALHRFSREFSEKFCEWEDQLYRQQIDWTKLSKEQIGSLWKNSTEQK